MQHHGGLLFSSLVELLPPLQYMASATLSTILNLTAPIPAAGTASPTLQARLVKKKDLVANQLE
jgi:hypothetical protein